MGKRNRQMFATLLSSSLPIVIVIVIVSFDKTIRRIIFYVLYLFRYIHFHTNSKGISKNARNP